MPSLREALEHLRKRRQPEIEACLQELSQLHRQLALVPLFRDLFPGHFHKALKKIAGVTLSTFLQSLFPTFLQQINRHYFPVDDFDLDWVIDQYPLIPVPLMNHDVESEFEHEPVPIQIVAHLVGAYSYAPSRQDIARLLPGIRLPACWTDPNHWCHVNQSLLDSVCRRHPSPLRNFPLLYATLAHGTGIIYFDVTYESGDWGHDYTWSKETILDLRAQWQRAQPILKQNLSTIRQFERHPEHWNILFTCWEQMCQRTKDQTHAA